MAAATGGALPPAIQAFLNQPGALGQLLSNPQMVPMIQQVLQQPGSPLQGFITPEIIQGAMGNPAIAGIVQNALGQLASGGGSAGAGAGLVQAAAPLFQTLIADGETAARSVARQFQGISDNVAEKLALLDSGPLFLAVGTAIKNAPQVFFGETLGLNQTSHKISARLSFLEVAVVSAASTVYNFAIALIFTVCAGLAKAVSFCSRGRAGNPEFYTHMFRKYWMHTANAGSCIGVGLAGTVSPKYGIYAAGSLLSMNSLYVVNAIKENMITSFVQVYRDNTPAIRRLGITTTDGDIETRLRGYSSRVDAITNQALEALRGLLRGRMPTLAGGATPAAAPQATAPARTAAAGS